MLSLTLDPYIAYLDHPTDAIWKATSNQVLTHRPEHILTVEHNQSGGSTLQTPWAKGCNVSFTAEPDVIELFEFMISTRMEIVKAVDRLSLHSSGNTADHPIQLSDHSALELTDDRHRSLALLFHRIIRTVVRMCGSPTLQPIQSATSGPLPPPPATPRVGSRDQPHPLPIHKLGPTFFRLLSNRKRILSRDNVAIDQGIPVAPRVAAMRRPPLPDCELTPTGSSC